MAQLNITLNQEEIMHLLEESTGEAFKKLLQESLNAILRVESDAQIGAGRYERADQRLDYRNGSRNRPLTTRIGKIELDVPRHRNAPFKTLLFDNYKTSESALIATMAEMVVAGVSTAKVGRVMETLCGANPSKQAVSEACKILDEHVEEFCSRPIDARYPFVMVDATYLKVREHHRIVSRALMIALGFNEAGRKEIIGFTLADDESARTWEEFLSALKQRGLHGMKMLTSDAHEGIIVALQKVFPQVAWQRCQAHFTRNIVDAAPKKYRIGLRSELAEMFNCDDIQKARARRGEIMVDYADIAPDALTTLDAGFDDAMSVMELPRPMRRCVRTTNYLERLNREVKRRSKVIGVFPNSGSVMRLVGSVLIEENDRWAKVSKHYYSTTVEELEGKSAALVEIARIQKELAKAA